MVTKQKGKGKLKEKWVELYSSCSFDGFHHIFDERGWMRLFWIVIVLGAITFAVALFYGAIRDFFTYKTATSYEELLSNKEIEFPTVTICNINSVSRQKLEENSYNLTIDELVDFYQKIHDGKINESDPNTARILKRLIDNKVDSLDKIFRRYEFTLKEMHDDERLTSIIPTPCKFSEEICNKSDFQEIISARFGLCYQFNSIYLKNKLFSKKAGEGTGLKIYFNVPEDDMMVSNVPYSGLQVFIHPYGEPFESAIAKPVPVAPGSINFIFMTASSTELLKDPYPSNCSSQEYTYVKKIVPYARTMCQIDCVIGKMMKKCGCVAMEMGHHLEDPSKVCGISKLECTEKLTVNIKSELRHCAKHCPRQCKQVTFKLASGSTSMQNTRSINLLSKKYNVSAKDARAFISQNFFGMDISYSDIVILREIISPAQNWVTLLSQIGGSLGLAMGCSAVTFIEFIVFGIQALKWYCKGADNSENEKRTENGTQNKSAELV